MKTEAFHDEADQTAILDPKPAHTLDWLLVDETRAHPIIIQDGVQIATVDGYNLIGLNHAQTAARIVLCVNSHDALVKACKRLLAHAERLHIEQHGAGKIKLRIQQ